jgi:hypothetical protein
MGEERPRYGGGRTSRRISRRQPRRPRPRPRGA